MKLHEAYEAYDQGQIDFAALQAEQDVADEDPIRRLEATGAVPRRSLRRGREGHPRVLRRGRRARLDRLHRGPAGEQERQPQSLDQQGLLQEFNPLDPRVETAQEVCEQLVLASKYIPVERLGATDDCGFSPFSRDEKPKHRSPDFARDIAMQKIANRVKGAAMASEQLGI